MVARWLGGVAKVGFKLRPVFASTASSVDRRLALGPGPGWTDSVSDAVKNIETLLVSAPLLPAVVLTRTDSFGRI